jgi:hypothetical protein
VWSRISEVIDSCLHVLYKYVLSTYPVPGQVSGIGPDSEQVMMPWLLEPAF